jgi:hypothetical protein
MIAHLGYGTWANQYPLTGPIQTILLITFGKGVLQTDARFCKECNFVYLIARHGILYLCQMNLDLLITLF